MLAIDSSPPTSLLKEELVKIGAVNLDVAHGARLIFLALVVERGQPRHTAVLCNRVAFKAEEIHLTAFEQTRISGPVRTMTGNTTLGLDGPVLKREGPRLIGMALEADLVLRGSRPQLLGQETAVRIMTIAALHQPLFNTMSKRPVKLLFLVGMAAVTKIRLFRDE